MTRKQANILRALKAKENVAWVAYVRGNASIAEALEVFGKDTLYSAWLQECAKVCAFHYTCQFGGR